MRAIPGLLLSLLLLGGFSVRPSLPAARENSNPAHRQRPRFVLVAQYPTPVITVHSEGAAGNRYGFEGGRLLKLHGTYHLFTSEMAGDPIWVKMKLAHWESPDRIHWKRIATLYESSGEFQGKDPRAALWAPMPVYDQKEERWNLFYVAYSSEPDTKTEWRNNFAGTIWRAVSKASGPNGIDGPYQDVGIILHPDSQSEPWEGLQGTDSFFPYKVGTSWYGFYGSAKTEHIPITLWAVGLASAPALAGPWKRCAELNPLKIETVFAENPIVTRLDDGTYAAVYDSNVPNAIGYTWSADGVHWGAGEAINVQPQGTGKWADDVRTPLGLIPEGRNRFTVFYTGYQKPPGTKGMGTAGVGFATFELKQ